MIGTVELASIFASVILGLSIDKFVRVGKEPESESLLMDVDHSRDARSRLERFEDLPRAEFIFPLVSLLVSSAVSAVPFIFNAYGDSGFVWCWIKEDLEQPVRIFLVLFSFYGWMPVSWIVIIYLSARIAKSKNKRYIVFLGVFIVVWIPPTIQRISALFVESPFWLYYMHTVTSNLKGTLNFTVVVIILYGNILQDAIFRIFSRWT